MAATAVPTETEIIEQLVTRRGQALTPEAARGILAITFDERTKNRVNQLLRKNSRGSISAEERLALERHLRVGQLLDLLHARAMLALKGQAQSE